MPRYIWNEVQNMKETTRNYAFFQNRKCEYFPCHKGIAEEDFNCLFCYCPLYMLGRKCGGDYSYTEKGFKDCSNCVYPHKKCHYDALIARYGDIAAFMAEAETDQ